MVEKKRVEEDWFEDYISMGLYNTVETESEESETEYDQINLSSDEECSFTETDNPDENGKEDLEILPIEVGAYTIVSFEVMQKMVDERASCKYCGGNYLS